jgi:NADH:ubiquinone oxidoreductase subunit
MQVQEHSDEQEFVSVIYRGRPIATLNHFGRWHVYLDHVLQNKVVFETADEALAWLMHRVDQRVPARLH